MNWLINMLSEISDIFSGDAEFGERNDRNDRKARGERALAPVRVAGRDRRGLRRNKDHEDRFDHFW